MDPHKRTLRFPFFENVALGKPRGRTAMMRFASNILVYPRICGRQPTAKVLVRFVTYEVVSASAHRIGNIGGSRTFHLVNFNCYLLHED
jgi:hypothetical protein